MDDDGSLGMRNWGFFEPPTRNNLGLQLMSSMPADRDTKQLLSSSPFIHQHHHVHPHAPQHTHHHPHPHPHLHPRDGCGGVSSGAPNDAPSVPMNFVHNEAWMHPAHHPRESKILHAITTGHAGHVVHTVNPDPTGYGIIPGTNGLHTLQMMQKAEPQPPPPPKDECISPPLVEENAGFVTELPPPKKKQQRRQPKSPKPKKAKKAAAPCEDGAPKPVPRRRGPKKHVGMVINGIDLDLSRIPTPVCTCTGAQQQCYRWGAGGWQSACCTTTISTYPLPMSTKRHGARIAGRKMSHGAFKKVLEKLAGEGYNLNNPIDLKTFWAKHGTNKFVTIR
ncbi:barley B recombinant-like protein A [Brachypodium distachyon]|uniref:GAGA-binding transcriptional activator n=1 Tax=Brachypodium distachyon TaxID=15368 RepID=I1I323_BRADI|nr:barley B recombinant-like protein A [Brachypodium distachyon]KQJ96172.1 hypothetical protein BRADI_3g21380v3 [Brachypodium distachyon]|eukprot:XP_003573748.1 barley B recombinant-like protein A [Brachypodium distachyon]